MDKNEKLTAEQIELEISRLQRQLQEIKREEIIEHKRQSMVHLGRCFRTSDGRYAIVASVPQECETKTGVDYNPYQFPALWLSNAPVPFELDIVPSFALDKGEPGRWPTKFTEITTEEFMAAFEERVQRLRSTVEQLINSRAQQPVVTPDGEEQGGDTE